MWCQAGPLARIRPWLCCTTTSGSEALPFARLETTSLSTELILGMLSLFPRTHFAHCLISTPGYNLGTVGTSSIDKTLIKQMSQSPSTNDFYTFLHFRQPPGCLQCCLVGADPKEGDVWSLDSVQVVLAVICNFS